MFNFYVGLAGQDMVTVIAGLPRAGAKSKTHDYKQKYKEWRAFRKHEFRWENNLKISDGKNYASSLKQTAP